MGRVILTAFFLVFYSITPAAAQEQFEMDVISTSKGNLEITFIGHGTLMLAYDGKIIHVDPYSKVADFTKLPMADIILLTHHHRDHLDPAALELVRNDKTTVVLTEICARTLESGIIMKNGAVQTIKSIKIEAVPAYNLVHKRDAGQVYHPRDNKDIHNDSGLSIKKAAIAWN